MPERKTYALLKLSSGQEVNLADTEIPAGTKIHQLRLILGDDNTVNIDGTPQALELETPVAQVQF
jgi:hypothetical protein